MHHAQEGIGHGPQACGAGPGPTLGQEVEERLENIGHRILTSSSLSQQE
jgi:hypothetical protein